MVGVLRIVWCVMETGAVDTFKTEAEDKIVMGIKLDSGFVIEAALSETKSAQLLVAVEVVLVDKTELCELEIVSRQEVDMVVYELRSGETLKGRGVNSEFFAPSMPAMYDVFVNIKAKLMS